MNLKYKAKIYVAWVCKWYIALLSGNEATGASSYRNSQNLKKLQHVNKHIQNNDYDIQEIPNDKY